MVIDERGKGYLHSGPQCAWSNGITTENFPSLTGSSNVTVCTSRLVQMALVAAEDNHCNLSELIHDIRLHVTHARALGSSNTEALFAAVSILHQNRHRTSGSNVHVEAHKELACLYTQALQLLQQQFGEAYTAIPAAAIRNVTSLGECLDMLTA